MANILLTRSLKQFLRRGFQACCSTSSTTETQENTQRFSISNSNPGFLEGKFMAADKFGTLKVDVPFDIYIEPLNVDKYPDMNKLFVKILYDLQPEEKVDASVLVALRQCYDFDVKIKDSKDFTATGNFKSKVEYPVKCIIQLPMKFGKVSLQVAVYKRIPIYSTTFKICLVSVYLANSFSNYLYRPSSLAKGFQSIQLLIN